MATLDLGKIKQVWRGTYNNSTAYTVDDVVEYTDSNVLSSYICVTNSTGNAPSSGGTAHSSWNYLAKGSSGGKTLQIVRDSHTGVSNSSNNYSDKYYSSNYSSSNGTLILECQITRQSTSSHFYIQHSGDYSCGGNAHSSICLWRGTSKVTTTCQNNYAGDAGGMALYAWVDPPSGQQTFQVRLMGSVGGHTQYVNSDHSGNNKNTATFLTVTEIED
jgi:hypothetical protein